MLFFLLLLVPTAMALCPCPGTECTNFTNVVAGTCTGLFFARGAYDFRVKAHTTNGSNITVHTMPGDKTQPCTIIGTHYTDLSQTTKVECYESSTYYLNTCSTNGASVVFNNENSAGDAPTNYIVIVTSISACPTPSPTPAPSTSPTPEPPSLSPTAAPTAVPTATPTLSPTQRASNTNTPFGDNEQEKDFNAFKVVAYAALAAVPFLICVFAACFVFIKRRKQKLSYKEIGGGSAVPLREKRNSRAHSRSSSKRHSKKFSRKSIDNAILLMQTSRSEDQSVIEI